MTNASDSNVYGKLNRRATQFGLIRRMVVGPPPVSHDHQAAREDIIPLAAGTGGLFGMGIGGAIGAPLGLPGVSIGGAIGGGLGTMGGAIVARKLIDLYHKAHAEGDEETKAAIVEAVNRYKQEPPPRMMFSEEEDNQSRAFTQQVFAAVFDFGRPNRTYLSHQFGEETQFDAADILGSLEDWKSYYDAIKAHAIASGLVQPDDIDEDEVDPQWLASRQKQSRGGRAPTIGVMDGVDERSNPLAPMPRTGGKAPDPQFGEEATQFGYGPLNLPAHGNSRVVMHPDDQEAAELLGGWGGGIAAGGLGATAGSALGALGGGAMGMGALGSIMGAGAGGAALGLPGAVGGALVGRYGMRKLIESRLRRAQAKADRRNDLDSRLRQNAALDDPSDKPLILPAFLRDELPEDGEMPEEVMNLRPTPPSSAYHTPPQKSEYYEMMRRHAVNDSLRRANRR